MYDLPTNCNYYQLMSALDKLTKLKCTNEVHSCLLRNHPHAANHFYNQSHGELQLSLHPDNKSECCSVILAISSIDDGSIVLLGPSEPTSKAQHRLEILMIHVEKWHGWIPTVEQVKICTTATGTYWNR